MKDAKIPVKTGVSGRSKPECPAYPRRVKVAAIQYARSEATRNPAGNSEVSARTGMSGVNHPECPAYRSVRPIYTGMSGLPRFRSIRTYLLEFGLSPV
jgi:hypothetical protein